MPPPLNNEIANLAYRVGAVEKDIGVASREIAEIKSQLTQKTTERENDLRFKSIDDKVQLALDDIREIKENIKDIISRGGQEQKDNAGELKNIRELIAKIQIGSLVFIVAFFLTIIGTIVTFLITHIIS